MSIDFSSRIQISDRSLPRDEQGNYRFDSLEHLQEFFEDDEIVVLVCRHLTNSEASKESNKKRAASEREMMKAIKQIAKDAFNKRFDDLSQDEQLEVARRYASKIQSR